MNRYLMFALTASTVLSSCGSSGWDHKAVADVKAASDVVGGFSADDTRLYKAGLQHITNRHQRPGQFTIRQVINGERSREEQRADAKASAHQKALDHAAQSEATVALKFVNQQTGQAVYQGVAFANDSCLVVVDGNVYEYLSEQDRAEVWKGARIACVAGYRKAHGVLPDAGITVTMQDLAERRLEHDFGIGAKQ